MKLVTKICLWLKANTLNYLVNLCTFILGISASGLLILTSGQIDLGFFNNNQTNQSVGLISILSSLGFISYFYFFVNILVGATVWSVSNKVNFRKSFFSTFCFYASITGCAVLCVLLADAILGYIKSQGISTQEIPLYAFISLVSALTPCLIINAYLYGVIKKNVPILLDDLSKKYIKTLTKESIIPSTRKSQKQKKKDQSSFKGRRRL